MFRNLQIKQDRRQSSHRECYNDEGRCEFQYTVVALPQDQGTRVRVNDPLLSRP